MYNCLETTGSHRYLSAIITHIISCLYRMWTAILYVWLYVLCVRLALANAYLFIIMTTSIWSPAFGCWRAMFVSVGVFMWPGNCIFKQRTILYDVRAVQYNLWEWITIIKRQISTIWSQFFSRPKMDAQDGRWMDEGHQFALIGLIIRRRGIRLVIKS